MLLVCLKDRDVAHGRLWPDHVDAEEAIMLAAFSITPLGGDDSVSEAVAAAVRVVRESGLPSETNAMFTNVEGEWDEVMEVIRRCVEVVAEVAPRVSVVVKIDHRPSAPPGALSRKVEAVERRLEG